MKTKNKTAATWLALLLGPLGMHRFYLKGLGDTVGWLYPIPTALGLWGIERLLSLGQDDKLSWVLIPLLGFTVASTCLTAILYALTDTARWNARYQAPPDGPAGRTNGLTITAIVISLLLGAGSLMASLAFSFQHYFEYQVQEARKISQ